MMTADEVLKEMREKIDMFSSDPVRLTKSLKAILFMHRIHIWALDGLRGIFNQEEVPFGGAGNNTAPNTEANNTSSI